MMRPAISVRNRTCGKIQFAPNACGFFGGYVGFPFFAAVGVLAVGGAPGGLKEGIAQGAEPTVALQGL